MKLFSISKELSMNRFHEDRERIIKGLSKKPIDFFWVSSFLRDAQYLIDDYRENLVSINPNEPENLKIFCGNVWDEGYKNLDGWDNSIKEVINRLKKLECK
jgi:hypothetical protein